MELTKIEDEKVLVSYLIEGFNSNSLSIASDPIAEFLDPSWTDEIKKGFKTVVKTYAANLKLSIEDAVALIKPAYLASLKK
jgi:hypothetical protein